MAAMPTRSRTGPKVCLFFSIQYRKRTKVSFPFLSIFHMSLFGPLVVTSTVQLPASQIKVDPSLPRARPSPRGALDFSQAGHCHHTLLSTSSTSFTLHAREPLTYQNVTVKGVAHVWVRLGVAKKCHGCCCSELVSWKNNDRSLCLSLRYR